MGAPDHSSDSWFVLGSGIAILIAAAAVFLFGSADLRSVAVTIVVIGGLYILAFVVGNTTVNRVLAYPARWLWRFGEYATIWISWK